MAQAGPEPVPIFRLFVSPNVELTGSAFRWVPNLNRKHIHVLRTHNFRVTPYSTFSTLGFCCLMSGVDLLRVPLSTPEVLHLGLFTWGFKLSD